VGLERRKNGKATVLGHHFVEPLVAGVRDTLAGGERLHDVGLHGGNARDVLCQDGKIVRTRRTGQEGGMVGGKTVAAGAIHLDPVGCGQCRQPFPDIAFGEPRLIGEFPRRDPPQRGQGVEETRAVPYGCHEDDGRTVQRREKLLVEGRIGPCDSRWSPTGAGRGLQGRVGPGTTWL
jgi:hypothetical protein